MITLKRATREAISYACLKFHYAKVVPSSPYAYNVYNADGIWCGVVIFGPGASPNLGVSVGLKQGEYLELVRVALNGNQPCTSEVVAACLRQVHRDAPEVKIIISFADKDQNHFGTIYQATNWIYLGTVNEGLLAAFIIHGKRMHRKSVHSHGWVQSIGWLREHVDPDAREYFTKGKRKYIYVFDKRLRKEWQKKAVPYPKKSCGSGSTEEYPAILREDGGSTPALTLHL